MKSISINEIYTPAVRILVLTLVLVLLQACAATGSSQQNTTRADRRAAEAARINTELGVGYMRRGNFELAIEKLKKAIAFDPDYVDAHTSLAVLYREIGDLEKSEQYHKRAVRAEPENAEAQNNYGTFLCQIGRYEESEERFMLAAESPFYDTPDVALTNAGRCAALVPDYSRAEKHLRNALQFKPNSIDALFVLAQIKLEQQEYMTARAFLQRYESTSQPTAEGLLLGYQIERQLADAKAAAAYAEELQKRFPGTRQSRTLKDMQNNEPASPTG